MNHAALYDVLVVIDHYLPGRLAGGPVTTLANMTSKLGSGLKFLILTRNYDLDGGIYEDVIPGRIYNLKGADVYYADKLSFNVLTIRFLIKKYSIPTVYLNSFFSISVVVAILAHKMGLLQGKLVLAPRGEFSAGALNLKSRKKELYLGLFLSIHLEREVHVFQASSFFEQADIWRNLGPVPVWIAADLAAPVQDSRTRIDESPKFVFISRISRKKNLHYVFNVLSRVYSSVVLDIYGPLEDQVYWQECQRYISQLPDHVKVNYCGTLEHGKVSTTLGHYSALIFPTLGENFGHVIFEALAAGCPVLVSDQTPWQALSREGVGWVIPLSQPHKYAAVIESILADSPSLRRARAERCINYARKIVEDQGVIDDNLSLFQL